MRNRLVCLTAALLIGFIGLTPVHAQDGTNILVNGGFEDGVLEPWYVYGDVTAEVVEELVGAAVTENPIEGDYCLHLEVHSAGANFWDSHLVNPGYVFEQGKHYTLSAFFKCNEGTLQINFKPELGENPYTGYGEQVITITEEWAEYSVTTPVFAVDTEPGNITFHIAYTAGDFWVDGVRFYEGDYAPPVLRKKFMSARPNPEKGAVDVPRDTTLSWASGESANTHDVYFGTIFEDVNTADRNNPADVLVSRGQTANTFVPDSLLDFGQTYYWRIDEVNNLNPDSPWKGDVWSFTAEPFVYPIENITATASSWQTGMEPENTVNGSGLDDNDLHSTENAAMWLSGTGGPQPTWIQYEFDRAYKLHEMWVWNSNMAIEPLFGLGMKDVTVEYSTNGSDWTILSSVSEFAQGLGTNGYAHNAPIDLSGVVAKYVKITANSSWGGMSQYGLSEVRFLYKPVRARVPQPASGQADVAQDVVLSWREAREAASHEVYFSTDRQAVIDGTALVDTVNENSYDPGPLELRKTYYWKINEVNDVESPTSWQGDVWSFSTLEYSVVDDFEQYNDTDNIIYNVWADYAVNNTGATVGYLEAPFAERSIVHEGLQSMPFRYDNDGTVNEGTTYEQAGTMYYSEAEREWAVPQDWTRDNAEVLTLFFRGNPQAFVELSPGNIVMSGTGEDIYQTTDEFRYAYKRLDGDGSITARIESIQYTNEWAKAGVMIRPRLEPLTMQAQMIGSPSNRVEWMYRPMAGAITTEIATDVNSTPLPHWVRLTRQGNTFIGEHSADGLNWSSITEGDPTSSSIELQMPATVYIGLAVTSHESGILCKAEFSEVSTTGNVTGQWQLADVGVAQGGNEAEQLYVAVEDSAGNVKIVNHPDNPDAVLATDWQQWDIPLTVFSDAGVDLTAVNTIYIGVGNPADSQAGGEGMLYVDDIRLYPPPPAE